MAVQITSHLSTESLVSTAQIICLPDFPNLAWSHSTNIIDRQYAKIDWGNFKSELESAHLQLFDSNCHMAKYRNVLFQSESSNQLHLLNNCRKATQKITKPTQTQHLSIHIPPKDSSHADLPRQPASDSSKLSIRKVFLVMSRVHHSFKLRFQTLFLALEIYLKYQQVTSQDRENPEQQNMPEGCLILVSLFLAMKFQQIYPPRLKCLFPFVKVDITTKQYTIYETLVLLKLNANLALKTAKDLIDQLLKQSPKETHFQAYYFLEIAYSSSNVTQSYSIGTITQSIFYILSPITDLRKSSNLKGNDASDTISCSKLLIEARNTHNQNDSTINRKYSHERYMKAAERPWISLRRQD